jgi:preprotein translocase subunit SecG
MLSFLREQGGTGVPARKADVVAGETSAGGVEQPQGEQYLTVAKGRTRRSTILLAVLFIAGLLCLWFMIRKSTPSAAVAMTEDIEEVQVEAALSRLTGFKSELFKRMDEIVRRFYEFSNVLQVKVDELAKNPFALELEMKSAEESEVQEVPKIDPALFWRQEVERKAQGFQLLSIMQSDQGKCCMIGDTILRKGDSIQGFKVRQIGEDFVTLHWEPEHDDRPPDTENERIEIVLKLPE